MSRPPTISMSVAAERLRQILVNSERLSAEEWHNVVTWWQSASEPDEALVSFLIRRHVLNEAALEQLDDLGGDINVAFRSGGFDRLRREAEAPHPRSGGDTTPIQELVPDTVLIDRLPQSEPLTQLVGALPIVRTGSNGEIVEEPALGSILGSLRLVARLGRGAKGIVYEAEDLLLGRSVAVKVLAPEMAARGIAWSQRFLQEARLSSRLDHPLILAVHAVGQENGLVYYTMPLLRGRSTWDALQNRGPFPPIEATRIVHLAALALSAAHEQGFSHGNVKPSNLFIADGGLTKLADFAQPHVPLVERDENFKSVGTKLREDDIATDLRMLAATYAWLLTGKPPSDRGSDIPAGCRRVIDRALHRERSSGYVSAAEMAADLVSADDLLRITETAGVATAEPGVSRLIEPLDSVVAPRRGIRAIPEVGQVLGKCLLTERIGHGSAGVVFRARHQSLNIPVAVKVLNVTGDRGVYRQLKCEAHLLAQLNHPNIVRVWDFEDDPTLPYLVLEHVEGPSLADVIRANGRMAPDRAVQVIAQVASALAAAYRYGVVHRDVKPGNILLTSDGTAKLADLGLAVLVDPSNGQPSRHTLAGTVAYMPPEQAISAGTIDHRSDMYALGASLYHLVTGQIPFQGATRMEVILKHAKEAPVPPHELAPNITPDLSELIVRMMAKAPADRFRNYDDLLRALAELDFRPRRG